MKITGILLAAILWHGPSMAQTERDGAWFAKLSDTTQLAFIAGYLHGMESGFLGAAFAACKTAQAPLQCIGTQSNLSKEHFYKYVANLTPVDVHNGVKSFYSDYRNVRVQVAYAIMHTGKAIHGVPAAELDRDVESVRRLSAPQ